MGRLARIDRAGKPREWSSGRDRAHRARRWRKNSRLPVAPVIGDGVIPMRTSPLASASAVTRSMTASCTAGSVTRPCLPTSSSSGLELRFDQRDDVAAGSQEQWQRGKDVTERDEGDVDRDDVDRVRQVGGGRARAR